MDRLNELLARLWKDYVNLSPQVNRIYEMLTARGEAVHNDHIAFRTFDDPRVDLKKLARSFEAVGYEAKGQYEFPQKHLTATHYEHPDAGQPRIFISELETRAFSGTLRTLVKRMVDQVPTDLIERNDFPVSGRLWEIHREEYEALAAESEYAGWVGAFGFRANHFTVDVNRLKTFESLVSLNSFLVSQGIEMNQAGGMVKGSKDVYLEQSSTLAEKVEIMFVDGKASVPGVYYEFARRYEMPNGKLFGGFVAKSADWIFQSTDRR